MNHFNDPFLLILPTKDVHGETSDTVSLVVSDFIKDNIVLKKDKLAIIHGKGQNILRKKIHEDLKKDKRVDRFYIYNFNEGITIIELKK